MNNLIILLVLCISSCSYLVPKQEQEDISSYRYDVPIEVKEEEKKDGK